jgi:hypothetical protein
MAKIRLAKTMILNTIEKWMKKSYVSDAAFNGSRLLHVVTRSTCVQVAAQNGTRLFAMVRKFVIRITASSMSRIIQWNRVSCYYRDYGFAIIKIASIRLT